MKTGTIYNKDSFLQNVANSLGREQRVTKVTRPTWKHQPQWNVLKDISKDELVNVLEKQCENIHTNLVRTTKDALADAIQNVLEQYGAELIVTWDDERFEEYGLTDYFSKLQSQSRKVHQWNPEVGDENIKIAEQADVGITFSDMTLAESGTVVLFSDKGKGRSVSLLPSNYIAIIPKSTIVPRMSQSTREIHKRVEAGETVPSCVNFITGPSNSADIEMNLVVGVHGPIKVSYIVIEDA